MIDLINKLLIARVHLYSFLLFHLIKKNDKAWVTSVYYIYKCIFIQQGI